MRKDKWCYGCKVIERIIELLEFLVVENCNYIIIFYWNIWENIFIMKDYLLGVVILFFIYKFFVRFEIVMFCYYKEKSEFIDEVFSV